MNQTRDEGLEEALHYAWKRLAELRSNATCYPAMHWSNQLKEYMAQPSPLPEKEHAMMAILERAFSRIHEGYCNVSHPLYLGYISPKPLAETVLGDFIASMLNQTPGAWRAGPAATQIEFETLAWIRTFIGLDVPPSGASGGLITSGGSMANLLALKLARDRYFPSAVANGLMHAQHRPAVYMSREGHFSVLKSADMLGLGRDAIRWVDTDRAGKIDLEQLQQMLHQDQQAHWKPICIVGVAGTSATGAVDPLDALADIANQHGCWYHIDGAAGLALASLSESGRLFHGMRRADSLSLDPCKWLFTAFGLGCLLLRDETALRSSFDVIGHYWQDCEEPEFFRNSFYGTRQWRSLGLWMAFNRLGAEGYRALLGNMCQRAQQLRTALEHSGEFELLPSTVLPVCCFRPRPTPQENANHRARALLQCINDSGQAYLTLLDWRGESYLRAAFNNYETNSQDVEKLVRLLKTGLLNQESML